MASVRVKHLRTQAEDDDYWNADRQFKPFNFDDDDVDNNDSIDLIRWDGSTATPIKNPSRSTAGRSSANKSNPANNAPLQRPASARISSARVASARVTKRNNEFLPSPASLPGPHQPSSKTNEPHTLSEAMTFPERRSTPTTTDVIKLETEINSLKRQLAQAKRDRSAAPSVEDTLRRLMVGDPYVFELYKSKEDKCKILDKAIARFDGNAIVAATLFMRDTLKRDHFSKELMSRPVAVDHYCTFLQDAGEIDELHETLSALGRNEEAAMLKYKQCLSSTSASAPRIRTSSLQDCIKYYFDSDIRLVNETNAIIEEMSLITRQNAVDDADAQAEKSGEVLVFKSHPRKDSILYKSVITTLFYCCYYHWGEAEGLLSSPTSVQNVHKIGKKQFMYTALAALCRMRRWRDIESMLTTPRSLFRGPHLSAIIGFEKVVDVLSKNLAPGDILSKYCAEIENQDKRLEWAKKLSCYKVVIDTLVQQRNRQLLMRYLDEIPTQDQHMRQYLTSMARSSDIKWRN